MRHTLVSVASSLLLLPLTQGRSLPRLIPRGDAGVPGYNYQGCYTEATSGRALSGSSFFNDLMTVEKCAASCSAFPLFGVEYGRECFCGQSLNAGSVLAAETDCSFKCPGNSAETCGAGNRLNVYQKPVAPPDPKPTSYASEGCYTEPSNGRALTGKTIFDDSLTIEKCAMLCADFNYFGVEYYRECYCGNDLQTGSVPAPSTDCKYPCKGDNSEICGGDYRLNLYGFGGMSPSSTTTASATATPSPSNYVSRACYTEAKNSRALTGATYVDDKMTTELCAAACTGFDYFGTEYARECYCGNMLQDGSVPAPASDCSYTCSGNKAEKCGGSNRLNLYEFNSAISSSTSTTSMSSSSASSLVTSSTSMTDAATTSSVMVPQTTSTSTTSTMEAPSTSSTLETTSMSSTSTAPADTTSISSQSTTSTMESSVSSSIPTMDSSSAVSSSTSTSTTSLESSSSSSSSSSMSSSVPSVTSSSTVVVDSSTSVSTISPTSSSSSSSSSISSSTPSMTSSSIVSSTTTTSTTSITPISSSSSSSMSSSVPSVTSSSTVIVSTSTSVSTISPTSGSSSSSLSSSSMSSVTPSPTSSSTVSSTTTTSTTSLSSSSSSLSSSSMASITPSMTSSSTSRSTTSTSVTSTTPLSSSSTTSSRSSSTSVMTSSLTSSSTTRTTSTSTTATPTVTSSANLLKNGDFEATKAGDVAWTTLDQDGGVVVNFMAKKDSTTAPHGGAQQLSIAFNTVGGKNDETFGQTFTAVRATNYKFSIFTFAPVGGDKCKWDFYISDSSRSTTIATTSLTYSANDAALGKYVQTTLAFNSGSNTALTAYATLDCTAYKPGTALTFYADDATVTPA